MAVKEIQTLRVKNAAELDENDYLIGHDGGTPNAIRTKERDNRERASFIG